jgi:2-(1,2-epoxy-1,2-dihydrophenyl)acetyl-CoA isomerase
METLQVERRDGVVTVTFNRPHKKNAVNAVMWDELLETFREIHQSATDRCVILTGAGGAFCSGADLTDADPDRPRKHQLAAMRDVGDVVLALHQLVQPTIAKVTGIAAGVGCNMALGCDLIVASDEARFSQIFAKRGLSLDGGGSWLLPRLVGLHKAKELALFADILSAKEFEELGLVNRVVPAGEIDAFVDSWAERLVAGPPIALGLTKRLLNNAFSVTMEQALEDEGRSQTINFGTRDTAEAMVAFAQKREPTFEGR